MRGREERQDQTTISQPTGEPGTRMGMCFQRKSDWGSRGLHRLFGGTHEKLDDRALSNYLTGGTKYSSGAAQNSSREGQIQQRPYGWDKVNKAVDGAAKK